MTTGFRPLAGLKTTNYSGASVVAFAKAFSLGVFCLNFKCVFFFFLSFLFFSLFFIHGHLAASARNGKIQFYM